MSNIIISVLNLLIGAVAISVIILYISKEILNKWMDAKAVEYELNSKFEEFKINQQILESEKIRFNKLQEERADVIKELYFKVVDIQGLLLKYVRNSRNKKKVNNDYESISSKLYISLVEFIDYLEKNKILLDESIINNTKEIEDIAKLIVASYEDTSLSNEYNVFIDNVNLHIIKDEIPKFRVELEKQFKSMSGI